MVKKMKVKIAVAQQMILERNKEKNLKKALELLEQAAKQGAKIACLPDWFLTDTPTMDDTTENIRKLAETIPGPATDKICEKAKELKLFIVAGTMAENGEDGKLYLTTPVIDAQGKLIGKVRKIHLERAVPAKYEYDIGISYGPEHYQVFDTEVGKFGVIEGISPETPIILAMKGADILFHPYNISTRYHNYSLVMAKWYSINTCAYVAVSGRVGWHRNVPIFDPAFFGSKRGDLVFAGGSQVIFGGETLVVVPDFTEGVAVTEVDLSRPAEDRKVLWPVVFKKSSLFAKYMK